MWDNESERIGMQRCTPVGYALHSLADLIGFVGLLLLFGIPIYLGYRWLAGTLHSSLLWPNLIPFGVGLIGRLLLHFSWWLAAKRGFEYNDETCEASWLENGKRRTFRWDAPNSAAKSNLE